MTIIKKVLRELQINESELKWFLIGYNYPGNSLSEYEGQCFVQDYTSTNAINRVKNNKYNPEITHVHIINDPKLKSPDDIKEIAKDSWDIFYYEDGKQVDLGLPVEE